jgi:hypothetical protein
MFYNVVIDLALGCWLIYDFNQQFSKHFYNVVIDLALGCWFILTNDFQNV